MIKRYKKLYSRTLYITLILTVVFAVIFTSFIFEYSMYRINKTIVGISGLLMICSLYIGILVIPRKLQDCLIKELFSDNSVVVEIIIERCLMWKNIEKLSEIEKNIFHISEDETKKFYLKKEYTTKSSYRLVLTDETFSYILQDIYEDGRNFDCYWMIQFDKYYRIKKK